MPTLTGTKPFKSYDEQIALLKSRGLIINNDETAKDILKRMNYYRLSAYSLTLRKNDQFYPGVSIEDIVSLYDFDADLRKIIFEFSEIAETSARAYIAYYHAQKYGPLGYLNNQNFESELNHSIFLKELFSAIKRSSDIFVIHHKEDLEGIYPVWVAIEETTFGALSKFYKNMLVEDRKAIAKEFYGIPRKYVENFMQCASVARNIAAHGGRFYNRVKLNPAVNLPSKVSFIENDRPAAYIYAIYSLIPDRKKYFMLTALQRTFSHHPYAKPQYLGLPENWFQLFEDSQIIEDSQTK